MKKIIILLLFIPLFASGVMMAPQEVINHQTKECSSISLGDECVVCELLNNWELGECPAGYAQTELEFPIDYNCQKREDGFCREDDEEVIIDKNEGVDKKGFEEINIDTNISNYYLVLGSSAIAILLALLVYLKRK